LCAVLNDAQVIASEGERAAAVNRSEAQRCQFINNSEGERQATVNFAEGKAQQIVLEAQGRAQVVNMAATAQKTAIEMFVSAGLSPAEASRLSVALRYVDMLPSVLAVTAPTHPFHLSPRHISFVAPLPALPSDHPKEHCVGRSSRCQPFHRQRICFAAVRFHGQHAAKTRPSLTLAAPCTVHFVG
jgi:hypothetical protein